MMANNWQRLNIWLNLTNRFDYVEFTDACKLEGIEPQNPLEFSQKAGMISVAINMYPDLSISDAYLKFIQESQAAQMQNTQASKDADMKNNFKKEKVTIIFADGRTEEQEILIQEQTIRGGGCCGGGQVK